MRYRVCLFFILPLFFLSQETLAQKPLYTSRSKNIQRRRVQLPKARSVVKKLKKKDILKYIKPSPSTRLYFVPGTDEAELERVTLLEIEQLYRLFKQDQKPDIQLRLASLYVEMSRFIESQIYEKHAEKMELYRQKKLAKIPVLNLRPVRNYSQKAINLFQLYLKQYPRSKRAGEILFQLGYSYFQIGKPDKGFTYYERLIQKHPKSEQLEDAHFHLGEYFFDKARWKKARYHYDRSSRFRSKFYSFSLYKIAWCFYNEGSISKAIRFLVRLINDSKNKQKFNRSVSFAKEALGDLASFYVSSKRSSAKAYDFFENLAFSEVELFQILEKVAYAYKDTGNVVGMRNIFSLLIERDPEHPQAYEYQYQIVQAYLNGGNKKILNQEFAKWIRNYGQGSRWNQKNKSDADLIKKASNLMEVTLRNYVFGMHHTFIKTKNKYAKAQALFGYKMYVQHFNDFPLISDVRFQFGDLLFDSKKYAQAVEQYEIVVKKYPKSKSHAAATLNRVLVLEKMIPTEKQIRKMVKENKDVALPSSVKQLERAVKDYIRFYPKKKEAPNMIYLLATIHLEYKNYDKAIRYWMDIINNYSDRKIPKLVSQSVHSVLDTYNLMKDFKSLKKASQKFLQSKKIMAMPVAKEIRKILRQTIFNEAQQKNKEGQFEVSARLYEDFAKKNQTSDLAVPAIYNAAINYKKIGNVFKSIRLYSQLSQLSEASQNKDIRKRIMRDLPDLYQQTGQYVKAAQGFEKYAQNYPKDKNVADFWYNTGTIYDGLGLFQKAVAAYLKYYGMTKDPDRHQIYYLIARIRDRQGQKSKAIANYIKYINLPAKDRIYQIESSFRVARIHESRKARGEALKWYKACISLYKKFKKGVSYAAQSQFKVAYEDYKKLKGIRIPSQAQAQARAFQSKLNLLEGLKNKLKVAIQFDYGPEVVSSLTLMGLAEKHIGDVITRSPIPKGLDKKGIAQYKKGLKDNAQPFYDRARQYFERAISKARGIQGYMPWLKEAQKEMKLFKSEKGILKQRMQGVFVEGFDL